MRRTTTADLAAPFVVGAVLVYALLRLSYESIPPLQWFVAVPIAALAAVEYVAARRVRAAVGHRPDARPMAAVVIARCAALGKATAIVAALVAGAALGVLAYVVPDAGQISAAGHDTAVAAVLLVAAAALLGAGLVLERAAIDPGRDRDRPPR